jgi:hypothetical protein
MSNFILPDIIKIAVVYFALQMLILSAAELQIRQNEPAPSGEFPVPPRHCAEPENNPVRGIARLGTPKRFVLPNLQFGSGEGDFPDAHVLKHIREINTLLNHIISSQRLIEFENKIHMRERRRRNTSKCVEAHGR